MKNIKKRFVIKTLGTVVTYLMLLIFLFPLFWMYITSVKPDLLQMSNKIIIFFPPMISSYIKLFRETNFLSGYINSVIVTLFGVVINLSLASLAGYSLSRFRYGGASTINSMILNIRLMPAIIMLIPIFILFRDISLLNTKTSLIIMNVFFTLPISTLLLKGFFDSIPVEIEEAALVDGLNHFSIFLKIILPLSYGGFFAAAIVVFVLIWNDFLFSFILSQDMTAITAPVIVAGMLAKQGILFSRICAASSLLVTPTFILALFFGKYLVKGATMGAVK